MSFPLHSLVFRSGVMKQLIAAILFVLASLSGSLAEAQELRAPAEVQETRETLLLEGILRDVPLLGLLVS